MLAWRMSSPSKISLNGGGVLAVDQQRGLREDFVAMIQQPGAAHVAAVVMAGGSDEYDGAPALCSLGIFEKYSARPTMVATPDALSVPDSNQPSRCAIT